MNDTWNNKGATPHLRATRRQFIKGIGALAAGATLMPAGRLLAAGGTPREIRIGTFGPSHCATPFVYARLKGFFKDETLNVRLSNYAAMPLIAKDLINGKLDFGQLVVPLALAIHTGSGPFSRATPIVIPQITGTNGAALMVRPDARIKRPGDFKGKTLANHSPLSVHYLLNMMFLEKHGLDYQNEVHFKIVELGKVVDAVKKGQIDALVMPEPKNAVMEEKGIADIYMLSKYLWPNHPCCALVTTQKTLDSNEDLVAAVTRALTRAGLEADNPDTRENTIDLLRSSNEYKYKRLPKEVLLRAFIPGRADFCPFPYQSAFMLIIEEMKRHNLLPSSVDAQRLAREVALSDSSRARISEVGGDPPSRNDRAEKVLGKFRAYTGRS